MGLWQNIFSVVAFSMTEIDDLKKTILTNEDNPINDDDIKPYFLWPF